MKMSSPMILSLIAAGLVGVMLAAVPAPGKADGQLTVGGKAIRLTYAYANAQKGFFDPKTKDVRVILSDAPLDTDALDDDFARIGLAKEGKLHTVEVVINSQGQPISVTIRHDAFKVTVSGGSTEDAFESQVFDGKTAAGRMYRKSPGESFDDIPFTYDVQFNTAITPMK